MNISPLTPIIVGVGQFVERIDSAEFKASSAADLAAEAAGRAFEDALSLDVLRPLVDTVATTRTFEDSIPSRAQPFGKSNNFPWSIAKRLGLNPGLAIWEKGGGDSPQRLLNEMAERLSKGALRMVLLAGADNISTARWLQAKEKSADWTEDFDEKVDNRGMGLGGILYRYNSRHGLIGTPAPYSLFENARRANFREGKDQYAIKMAELFAPFSSIAAKNRYSSSAVNAMSATELITLSNRNRMIADLYPQRLVAKDQVNQGAAVLLTTVQTARSCGIPEHKWIFLRGHADAIEREIMDRPDLGKYPAGVLASKTALEQAGVSINDISYFDFYSCYPIAVSSVAIDGLGLSPSDSRGLTVTGGLPYFGGPGNNYSMHAICTMAELLRDSPGTYGFVGANGGLLSKYSVGVYSTTPGVFSSSKAHFLSDEVSISTPAKCERPDGWSTIETYTVVYSKGLPEYAVVVGRTKRGERFLAKTLSTDHETVLEFQDEEPIGRDIFVRAASQGNTFSFSEARMNELLPVREVGFRAVYQYIKVDRRGRLLEVTINRPEVRNSLHPMANEELDEVWDAYEADPSLWVAILTGSGTEAFSAGNDLKYSAGVGPKWIPANGFGGITGRVRDKPVIAAVNGFAMGGGFEMALACDIVVADDRAKFALSEVRVGLIAGLGGLSRLPRQIPKKVAVELILTGRSITAEHLLRLGFVNRIMPSGQALIGAREIAEEILAASPTCVRLSLKGLLEADNYASEAEASRKPSPMLDELFASEDYIVGPRAFAAKQKPNWTNR